MAHTVLSRVTHDHAVLPPLHRGGGLTGPQPFPILVPVRQRHVFHRRKLKLNNKKVEQAVVNVDGGLELLQASGFELVFEDSSPEPQAAATPPPTGSPPPQNSIDSGVSPRESQSSAGWPIGEASSQGTNNTGTSGQNHSGTATLAEVTDNKNDCTHLHFTTCLLMEAQTSDSVARPWPLTTWVSAFCYKGQSRLVTWSNQASTVAACASQACTFRCFRDTAR